MKFDVVALQRADADVRHISRWISERSLQGAATWLDAYSQLLDRLALDADSCAVALESHGSSLPLKQAVFGTKHGRKYRAVFTIVGKQVRILRVRGPRQPPLLPDELM